MNFVLPVSGDPRRDIVERAIRDVFAREFGATLQSLPPTLAALFDERGNLLSAVGLRFATDGFFSEHYLDDPVEDRLERIAGRSVERRQIVEIGSLSRIRPTTSLALVDAVAAHCLRLGISWAIFTATNRLRALLRRSGIPVHELAAACAERVPNPGSWGSYYLHDPRLVAVEGSVLPRFRPASPEVRGAALA